jgi:hypothetical protein
LVEFAHGRFEAHGLDVPHIDIIFFDSLAQCDGRKGRYYPDSGLIEMCTNEKATLLHEMAHAWARANLTAEEREAFVELRGLPSWNDHDHSWETRGTEHVAETIVWALSDEPTHVKWVETSSDGTDRVEHRLLTIEVNVETLSENFHLLTGTTPLFRHAAEWSTDAEPPVLSPEASRGA